MTKQRRVLEAIARCASDLGLRYSKLNVVSARENVMVRLDGSGLVARAAIPDKASAQDPAVWMAREVRVAGSISAAGGPVVAPAATVPPGPYQVDGISITFWTAMEAGDGRPSLVEVAAALGAFHTIGIAAVHESLPMLSPVFERIPARLATLKTQGAVDAPTLRHLHAEFDTVCEDLGGSGNGLVVLHGDAHGGNLMHDGTRWLWIDLEETCLGPPEWDLTVMFLSNRLGGPEAMRQYAECTGRAEPTPTDLAPFIRARRLASAVWAMCMMAQYPGPFDEIATRRLAAVLNGIEPGR